MNKTKHRKILYIALICLNLLFIWGNSLLDSKASTRVSDVVTETVGTIIGKVKDKESNEANEIPNKIEANITDTTQSQISDEESNNQADEEDEAYKYFRYILSIIVRKGAHMLEFFLLSIWLMLLFEKKYQTILLCGVFTALIDETIQIYTGRTSRVSDVWIDVCGFVIGMAFVALIGFVIKRKKSGSAAA